MENSFTLDNLNVNSYRVDILKLPDFNYKVKSVDTPSLTLTNVGVPTPFQKMNVPGDTVEYGTFTMSFIIDENLYNYMAVYNWITGLGFPDSHEQFRELISGSSTTVGGKHKSFTVRETSDITVHLLTNHKNSNRMLRLLNAFPISLSGIPLNISNTDAEVVEATVEFSFTGMHYQL